ncbi:MAG: hypothetical protein A4S09_02610 [Proteobacteria bacterium SG_bin7]|nr:MAG: hypothetical protein A4S09_02610 [Proteobacteria bacterium SG_bin7]
MSKILIAISILVSIEAIAIPLRIVAEDQFLPAVDYNFNGIAKTSICSASVVKFRNESDDAYAKILTNGHCIGMGSQVVFGHKMPAPGEVFVNVSTNLTVELLADDGQTTVARIYSDKLIYGTMTDTDLALFRLGLTYKQLKSKYNVGALVIADRPALQGTAIQVISGYWRRGYSCNLDGYVYNLKEDAWTFKDSLRYSEEGCRIVGGTSGSPVIAEATREVIGVNNTTNESGQKCTLNNPCEVTKDGKVTIYNKGGYGQHTDWLYSCLNDKYEVDLSVAGCTLPKPRH